MKKSDKSLLKKPIIIITTLMTILNLIAGNVPISILFTVLFFGNIIVQKLDYIEEEKRRIRKLKEKEIISDIIETIENIFKIAKRNNIKIIKEDYVRQIFNINNNNEFYYETSLKKQKNEYNF